MKNFILLTIIFFLVSCGLSEYDDFKFLENYKDKITFTNFSLNKKIENGKENKFDIQYHFTLEESEFKVAKNIELAVIESIAKDVYQVIKYDPEFERLVVKIEFKEPRTIKLDSQVYEIKHSFSIEDLNDSNNNNF